MHQVVLGRAKIGHVAGGASDDERNWLADRRDANADAREAEADRRELRIDARERVLDAWEREITTRAAALGEPGDGDQARRDAARAVRTRDAEQRREDAEARRDAAIERSIRQTERLARAETDTSSDRSVDGDSGAAFARLAAVLHTRLPLVELLERILLTGIDTVAGCAAASVALTTQGRLETAASTATWAAALDAEQIEREAGPLPGAATGSVIVTDDLTADERWPQLFGLSRTEAARGVVSFGLDVEADGTGVLTLYSHLGRPFARPALAVADLLAAHARAVLAVTLERLTYQAQVEAWQRGLASRDLIGQAKGILMQQRSCTADDAFYVLRDTSQRLNIKVRDVAEYLVTHRRLPTTGTSRPPR